MNRGTQPTDQLYPIPDVVFRVMARGTITAADLAERSVVSAHALVDAIGGTPTLTLDELVAVDRPSASTRDVIVHARATRLLALLGPAANPTDDQRAMLRLVAEHINDAHVELLDGLIVGLLNTVVCDEGTTA